jgi:hypothetical protein
MIDRNKRRASKPQIVTRGAQVNNKPNINLFKTRLKTKHIKPLFKSLMGTRLSVEELRSDISPENLQIHTALGHKGRTAQVRQNIRRENIDQKQAEEKS